MAYLTLVAPGPEQRDDATGEVNRQPGRRFVIKSSSMDRFGTLESEFSQNVVGALPQRIYRFPSLAVGKLAITLAWKAYEEGREMTIRGIIDDSKAGERRFTRLICTYGDDDAVSG